MLITSISYKLSIEKKTRSVEVMDIMNVYVYEKLNQYKKEELKVKRIACIQIILSTREGIYLVNIRK
jgi:hypothetical protein